MKNLMIVSLISILFLTSFCKKDNSILNWQSNINSLDKKKYPIPNYLTNDSLFDLYASIETCQTSLPKSSYFQYSKKPEFNQIKNNLLIQYAYDCNATIPKFHIVFKSKYPNDTLICFLTADSVFGYGTMYRVECESFVFIDINQAIKDLKPYNFLQIQDLNHCIKLDFKLNKY